MPPAPHFGVSCLVCTLEPEPFLNDSTKPVAGLLPSVSWWEGRGVPRPQLAKAMCLLHRAHGGAPVLPKAVCTAGHLMGRGGALVPSPAKSACLLVPPATQQGAASSPG